MARSALYAVFLLPVLFSAIFGTAVMADVLQKPDRELNMWRFGGESNAHDTELIEIMGIKSQYSASELISLYVKISDPTFDCGDLYVTIYSDDGLAVLQRGFFSQCLGPEDPTLPTNNKFSEVIDIPGTYEVVVELAYKDQQNISTAAERFTIK